jgi:hypothetical protein
LSLQSVRLTALGRYALGLTDGYRPPADDAAAHVLKILPNLDVVATGIISSADQLLLSAYAEHTADRVWTVSAASLLAAIDSGRGLKEFTTFLTQRTEHELPGSLTTLISDVTQRVGKFDRPRPRPRDRMRRPRGSRVRRP